jgi:hypothetical protein
VRSRSRFEQSEAKGVIPARGVGSRPGHGELPTHALIDFEIALVATGQDLAVEHVPARTVLIAEQPQPSVVGRAELDQQFRHALGLVGDLPAVGRL